MPAESLLTTNGADCQLNIGVISDGTYPLNWIILGLPFFQDFVTAYDYEADVISFGLSKNANEGAAINPSPNPALTCDFVPPGPDKPGSGGLSVWAIIGTRFWHISFISTISCHRS